MCCSGEGCQGVQCACGVARSECTPMVCPAPTAAVLDAVPSWIEASPSVAAPGTPAPHPGRAEENTSPSSGCGDKKNSEKNSKSQFFSQLARLCTQLGCSAQSVLGEGACGTAVLCTGENSAPFVLKVTKITKNTERLVKAETEAYKLIFRAKQVGRVCENVINCFSAGTFEDLSFYAVEYCSHGTLQQLIDSYPEGKVDEAMSKKIAKQLLTAVVYLHSLGIVHRDIKPDNVFVHSVKPLVLKLADYDRCVVLSQPCHGEGRFQGITTCDGSPYFMAPECLAGSTHTPNSDSFSLGMCLFDMMAGKQRLGFDVNDLNDLRYLHSNFDQKKFFLEETASKLTPECIDFMSKVLCRSCFRLYPAQLLEHKWLRSI